MNRLIQWDPIPTSAHRVLYLIALVMGVVVSRYTLQVFERLPFASMQSREMIALVRLTARIAWMSSIIGLVWHFLKKLM